MSKKFYNSGPGLSLLERNGPAPQNFSRKHLILYQDKLARLSLPTKNNICRKHPSLPRTRLYRNGSLLALHSNII
jgi:hypothetical protein